MIGDHRNLKIYHVRKYDYRPGDSTTTNDWLSPQLALETYIKNGTPPKEIG